MWCAVPDYMVPAAIIVAGALRDGETGSLTVLRCLGGVRVGLGRVAQHDEEGCAVRSLRGLGVERVGSTTNSLPLGATDRLHSAVSRARQSWACDQAAQRYSASDWGGAGERSHAS